MAKLPKRDDLMTRSSRLCCCLSMILPENRVTLFRIMLGSRSRWHPRDLCAERVQPLLDPLIAALDLDGIVDGGGALGANRGQQHRHAGADIGRGYRRAAQPAGARDDRA